VHAYGLLAEPYTTCGEDEDATSMALTAIHRLMRRGVRLADIGALHIASSAVDRSKSMKTELMSLIEAVGNADLEGVDHYGASTGASSALMSCISCAQGGAWDGRWTVAVCSNDETAPIGRPLSSAFGAAALVGRGSPMEVGTAQRLEHTHFVGAQQMAPLPNNRVCTDHQPRRSVTMARDVCSRAS
jgi:3-hydroxy-3-methylglutaryl CoA synthase